MQPRFIILAKTAVFGPFLVLFQPCFSAKVDTFCPPARKKSLSFHLHVAKCPKNKKIRHIVTITTCRHNLFPMLILAWFICLGVLYPGFICSDIRVSSPSEIRLPSQHLRSTILSGYTARQVGGDHSRRFGFPLCPTEEH